MTEVHVTHKFESDSHHRCSYCTRTRLTATSTCEENPEIKATWVRMFGLMVIRVYGQRRFNLATPAELAAAYARWGRTAPVNWPGYHGTRIARRNADWQAFVGQSGAPSAEVQA